MTVRELLSRVGSDELTEWMALYRVEPWGERRSDLQAGVVAATVANCNRAKAGDRTFGPEDFALEFGAREPQSAAEMAAKLRAQVLAAGGTIKER